MVPKTQISELIDEYFSKQSQSLPDDDPFRPRLRVSDEIAANKLVHDKPIVRFATFQLFSLIFLEKFAIGPVTAQVSIPLIIMFLGAAWMLIHRHVALSSMRFGIYLIFVCCCLFSQILANASGSLPSMLELFLIYSFMTLEGPVSQQAFLKILDRFLKMMLVPAFIGIFQYVLQTITGGSDPITIEPYVPKSLMLQGFFYDAHYPMWYDAFQRPNGLFFLEPSFFSFFLASALIIEIVYFRRAWMAFIMLIATFLSTGGTGMTMLALAAPMLLIRESPRVVLPVMIVSVVGLLIAASAGLHLPLISRLNELDTSGVGGGGSGGIRLVIPLNYLIQYLSDPGYLVAGDGSGSTSVDFGSAWPILKLTHEYGTLSMIMFVFLFGAATFRGNQNLILKIVITIIFHFTGGNLMDAVSVQFFVILFTIVEPLREEKRILSISPEIDTNNDFLVTERISQRVA
jgi:hypothetical protein